ncbi:biopolymer transporter ExbD [soil metagenome]
MSMNLRRSKVTAEFNMSSLTDIIFLLLIFFMLTSTLVAPNALKVVLPKTTASQTVKPKPVTVSLTADATFAVDQGIVNEAQLERVILDKVQALGEGANIVLYADKDATHEYVVKVLEIANRNKLPLVIATTPTK